MSAGPTKHHRPRRCHRSVHFSVRPRTLNIRPSEAVINPLTDQHSHRESAQNNATDRPMPQTDQRRDRLGDSRRRLRQNGLRRPPMHTDEYPYGDRFSRRTRIHYLAVRALAWASIGVETRSCHCGSAEWQHLRADRHSRFPRGRGSTVGNATALFSVRGLDAHQSACFARG